MKPEARVYEIFLPAHVKIPRKFKECTLSISETIIHLIKLCTVEEIHLSFVPFYRSDIISNLSIAKFFAWLGYLGWNTRAVIN